MDKDWSDKNKEFQKLISKEATFKEGIKMLLDLRDSLFEQITQIVNSYPKDAFWKMPFAGAEGYHSKTLAYSIWHIFRIEDIVLHTLILNNSQVLERGDWQKKIGAEIITTGNELSGQQIADFSKTLDIKNLYEYVDQSSVMFPHKSQQVLHNTESDYFELTEEEIQRQKYILEQESLNPYSKDEMKKYMESFFRQNKIVDNSTFDYSDKTDVLKSLAAVSYAKENGYIIETDGTYIECENYVTRHWRARKNEQ